MRFKAKLAPEQINALHSLVGPIARLTGGPPKHASEGHSSGGKRKLDGSFLSGNVPAQSMSVVHLDPDHLRMSVRSGRGDADGISCFAELTCEKIFLEHRIESAANDAIVFEIDLYMFKTALQSILSMASSSSGATVSQGLYNSSLPSQQQQQMLGAISVVVMKLAKKSGLSCLCFEAQQMGGRYGQIDQTHALPIRIMRAAEMQYHLPPRISMPDVQLELPLSDGRVPMRTVIERLKGISPQVYIDGCMSGELTLRIESDGASIRTFYNRLIPRFEDCKADANGSSQDSSSKQGNTAAKCTIKVDSKKLNSCFQWQTSLTMGRAVSSAVLCMVENEMLVLHVLLNPDELGFFTYYIPVHYLSGDQLE